MRLLLLSILFIIPAFFAASEVALIRLRPSRVEKLIEEEKPGAQSIRRLQQRMRRGLMVAQLGVTISLVSLGWLGQDLADKWFSKDLSTNNLLSVVFFISIVIFATLLSGLFPKAFVLNRPEAAALKLAPLIEAVMKGMGPLLYLLENIASFFLRLVGFLTAL